MVDLESLGLTEQDLAGGLLNSSHFAAIARVTIILLAGLVFLLGFSIAGMGAIIASGYRFALESGLA